jgi:hypothetical protein
MALFTDGEVSTIEDLRGYDSQLLDVAHTEGIDVTQKLRLAQEEIAAELATLLARVGRSSIALQQVVVTAPVKAWHTFLALELVYRDAHHSQLNDRYAAKRDEFRRRVKWAYDKVIEIGLGMASDPVGRAAPPNLQTCAGGLPEGTCYIAVAWTNAAGVEGAGSEPAVIELAGGSFSVQASAGPANVKGWNVYCGTAPESLTLQNASPLSPGETWVQPDTMRTGRMTGCRQAPDYLLPVPRMIQRG